jgi:hypothetical protein
MSELNFLDVTLKFNNVTMFLMFTDEELCLAFEAICSAFNKAFIVLDFLGCIFIHYS